MKYPLVLNASFMLKITVEKSLILFQLRSYDVMLTSTVSVSHLCGIPSVIFYDTEILCVHNQLNRSPVVSNNRYACMPRLRIDSR